MPQFSPAFAVDAIRLNPADVHPSQLEPATSSELPAVIIDSSAKETKLLQAGSTVDEGHLAFTSRELQIVVRDLIEIVTSDYADTSHKNAAVGLVASSEAARLKKQLVAIVNPLRDCIMLFESRGAIAKERRIARGVAEVLLWCAIRQRLEAIAASNATRMPMVSPISGSFSLGDRNTVGNPNDPESVRGDDGLRRTSALLNSVEYKWLLDILECNRFMTFGATNHCHEASRSRYLSLVRTYNHHGELHLSAGLDWSPFCLLDGNPDRLSPRPTLSSVITLCGDASEPYASTCEEYVKRIWPNFGAALVQCIQNAADSDLGTSSTVHKDIPLSARCTYDYTTVEADGPAVVLLEIFECAVWLGAACRPSTHSHDINVCEPSSYINFPREDISLTVRYHYSPAGPRIDQTSTSTCWRDMFRNPVIAQGYPVPLRAVGEEGLEISIPLLATLGQTFWATNFMDFC